MKNENVKTLDTLREREREREREHIYIGIVWRNWGLY